MFKNLSTFFGTNVSSRRVMFKNLSTFFGTNVSSRRVIPLYLCSSDFAALLVLSCIFRELVPDLVHTLDFSCSGDDDTVSNVTDRFRRATTVNLHQFSPVMDGIVHALARLEFLRTLNLAAGTQVVDIKIFSNFQHVEVIVVSGRNIQGNVSVFENTPLLKKLNLAECGKITGNVQVFENCPLLEVLNLQGCYEITGDIGVLTNHKKLKVANFSDCYNITGDVSVFEQNPKLVTLNLEWCQGIEGDIAVFRFCPNITDVGLFRTQVSGDICVFENTLALEELNLRYTKVIGDICVFETTPALQHCFLEETDVTGDKQAIKEQLPNCKIYF